MANTGLYQRIYLNRYYHTVSGVKTIPKRAADVIGVRLTGELDAVEVLSRTDNPATVLARNNTAMGQMPRAKQGRIYMHDDPGRQYRGMGPGFRKESWGNRYWRPRK